MRAIYLRGANAGHTLVLVDGMRIGSITFGDTSLENLPLDQIERIEILQYIGSYSINPAHRPSIQARSFSL